MPKTYDPFVVALSVLAAVWASYDALILVRRTSVAGAPARPAWLIAGSLAMGIGIWCMHFLGMLALRLPVSVSYDAALVVLSMLVAIVSATIAFVTVTREVAGRGLLWAGALGMGVAIVGLHFTGMAAMRLPAAIRYEAGLVTLSVVIATVVPFAALRWAFQLQPSPSAPDERPMIGPAVLMGLAIVGMHYAAMAAVQFTPLPFATGWSSGIIVPATPEFATVVALGAAGMLGMAQLGVVISRHEQRERAYLLQYRSQLQALAARIESAREEERTRIAREIHDELGQALTGLKLELEGLNQTVQDPAVGERTQRMTTILRNTLDGLRRLAAELRPPALDQLGLQAAILALAREFESRTGVRCHVEGAGNGARLDDNLATAVYRIVQEALTNVARHASAKRVDIMYRLGASELVIEVRDEGRGITDQELADPHSLGLLGMRERAHSWGAQLSIQGVPGRGTTVRVTIPLGAPSVLGRS